MTRRHTPTPNAFARSAGAEAIRPAALSVALLALLAGVLVSCGLGLPADLPAPDGVAATRGEVDLIDIDWNEVPEATRYYLYRSETADPFVAEDGPHGPVPYATTNLTSFTDTMPGARTYSYRVTAVEERTGAESPPSEVVTGFSVDGPIEWQGATRVGSFLTESTTSRLAVDHAATPPAVYQLAVGTTEDTGASVRRVEADGNLTQLGDAFGELDGSHARVADLAVHDGVLRAALVDASSADVQIWTYASQVDGFTLTATLPTEAVASRSPSLAFTAASSGAFWLAYVASDGAVATYRLDAAAEATDLSVDWSATDESGRFVPRVELAASQTGAVVAFEVENRSGDVPYPTVELAAATIANAATGWSSEAFDDTPSGDVSAFDLTIDAGTGANHLVVAGDVGVYLADASGATTELTAEFGGAPIPAPASIAIAAQGGTIRLLYLDDGESAAVIRSSDDAGDTWTVTSPDGFTADAELESLQLEAPDDRIFAGWIADASGEGAAFVRAYQ
jgi:hypothetical protein